MLTKKGQERLFVLKADSLLWFQSKNGAEKVLKKVFFLIGGVMLTYNAIQKARGSLPLKDVTVKRGPKGYSLVLQPKVWSRQDVLENWTVDVCTTGWKNLCTLCFKPKPV